MFGRTNNKIVAAANPQAIKDRLAMPFPLRLAAFGIPDLFYYENDKKDEMVVNIATLQRISLHNQQKHLVHMVRDIKASQNVRVVLPDELASALANYSMFYYCIIYKLMYI
jgi:hypothetical protein